MNLPTIIDANLPLITAIRAASERGQILQVDGKRAVICDRMLPGFTRIVGGGDRTQPKSEGKCNSKSA